MALSKVGLCLQEKHHDKDVNKDWGSSDTCGLCGSVFQNPKTLKCLHNFCLDCIREKSNTAENNIGCPTCDEITDLPSKGVDGLITNYMLIEKQELRLLTEQLKNKDTVIPCTYCDHDADSKDADNKAGSWCRQCEDYMCDVALKTHNSLRKAKLHDVISIEKLRSGDVSSASVPQDERKCRKHKDEKLRFYCETCEEPFCRDCGVIDHPRSESHVQVYLEDAVKMRSDEIRKEAEECTRVAREVDDTIAQIERVSAVHQNAVDQTLTEYDDAATRMETGFSNTQKEHRDKFSAELMQFDEQRKQEINDHKQKLRRIRLRIDSAVLTANSLADSGNQFDVADMYKDVITALRELRDFTPNEERFSDVAFKFNEESLLLVENLPAPGKLKLGIWELKCEFGDDGAGKVSAARDLAFTSTGDIVVTDFSAKNLKVFDNEGQHKSTPAPGNFTNPFGVAMVKDGSFYATDNSAIAKKFNAQIAYVSNFQSGGTLRGIAATKAGGWAICNNSGNCIYVYNGAGSQISTLHVMQPQYIAVTSKDDFVFSSINQKSVQIMNGKGHLLRVIGPPECVDNVAWIPYGVCCSPDDEVFVANRGEGSMGIYRFKSSGEYIDCITTEVTNPWGLAMSDNGENLAVVDKEGASIKLFGLK